MVKKNVTLDAFIKKSYVETTEKIKTCKEPYELPEGWRWVKLGSVAKIVSGFGFPKRFQGRKDLKYPFIKVNDMNLPGNEVFISYAENYVDDAILKEINAKIYPPNTIIFPKIGGAVATNKKRILKVEATFDNNIMGVIPNESFIEPLWLYYYFLTIDLTKLTKTTTMPSIRKSVIAMLLIPLPPIDEQRRIVARIEELVSRVEKAKRLRKAAKEETEKIMQAALHKVFSKAEERGWKWVKIKDVVEEFQSGFACSKVYATENGVPHLRPNNIGFWGELDLSELVFIPSEMVDLDKYSLKKGDVLFNNTNSKELVGRACIVREDLNYGFSNHITRLRVNKKLITPEWLVSSINYLWLRGYFLAICRKWIGQAGVNTTMLKNTKIPLPPLEEQKQIVTYLDKLSKTIKYLKKLQQTTDEELEKLVPAILDKAFKGRL